MLHVKNKFTEMGFNSGHALLMGLAVVVFLVLVFPQLNSLVSSITAQADDPQPTLTYEEVRDVVYGEMEINNDYAAIEAEQYALLDRDANQGDVLGSAIGIGEIPSIDQLYSPEQLSLIPVQSIVSSTSETIEKYSERVLRIEGYYNTLELFSVLNNSDSSSLSQAQETASAIEESLSQIPVPNELLDYHRYTVLYYRTLGEIGGAFAAGQQGQGLEVYTKTMFSLMDRLNTERSAIKSKFNVEL